MKKSQSKDICTLFGLGNTTKAPGTIGSLAALPFVYILSYNIYVYYIVIVVLFILGVKKSTNYCNKYGSHDPSEIILDEYVGQIATYILYFSINHYFVNTIDEKLILKGFTLVQLKLFVLFIGFILFRFFDISKLGLIGYVDKKVGNGLGIMLDDFVAAIFASVSMLIIITGLIYIL